MPARNPAVRVLAAEAEMMDFIFQGEAEDSNPPKYALTPSGVAANKVLLAGVVSDVTEVDNEVGTVLATLNDHSGDVTISATQEYSPEAAKFLMDLEPPEEVMVVATIRTYENDGELQQTINIQEGEHGVVPQEEYDQWAYEAIEQTISRLEDLDATEDERGPQTDPYLQYGEEDVEEVREIVSRSIENFEETR